MRPDSVKASADVLSTMHAPDADERLVAACASLVDEVVTFVERCAEWGEMTPAMREAVQDAHAALAEATARGDAVERVERARAALAATPGRTFARAHRVRART